MNKIPIVVWVWTYNFDEGSGGMVVVYKLCRMLREMGENVYIWINKDLPPGVTHAAYDIPIANGIIDPANCVMIYTEIMPGNPIGAKVVVRWILYFPEINNPSFVLNPGDIVVYYAPRFFKNKDISSQLCVFELNEEYFNFTDDSRRSGGCFTVRKGKHKPRITQTNNCLELQSRPTSLEYLVPIFKTKEVFYSYDTASMLSLQAAMCGCLSVVIPDSDMSAKDFREQLPLFKYGVAYGTSQDEIEYAKNTKHLVKDYLKSMEQEGYNQLKSLLSKLEPLRG